MVKEIDMQVQEAQRVPNQRPTPRQIIVKMPKVSNKEMGGQCGVMGEEVRGLRSTVGSYRILTGHKVQYRKGSSQRTYTHDPWT